ncbi:MAG: hypothetical protein WA823_01295 [Candidatus Acidiferrales bacterium]
MNNHFAEHSADIRANWRNYVGEFWRGDLGLTLLTLSLVVEVFVISPMRDIGVPGRIFFNLIVGVLMISGALAGSRSRLWQVSLVAAVTICGAVLLAARVHPSQQLHLWGSALTTVTLLLFVHVVLVVMFRGGPITFSRIQGGVCAYLLVGMAFASAYQFLEQLMPGSLLFVTPPRDLDQLSAKTTYYSFSILTTVGSEISAHGPYMRSLTTMEAIVGQLFPTILIGTLVALAIQSRPKSSEGS